MFRKLLTTFALLSALALPGNALAKIRVAASINDLASIASSVGGDEVEVFSIARSTADTHHIEVLPSYMVKVSRANVYLKVGLGLDQWADGIIDGSRNAHIRVVDCSKDVPLLEKPTQQVNASMGDVHVGGVLSDTGTVAGGLIEIIGCNVTVCGTASSSCPASASVGQLNSLGPSGINRVTGRNSSVILGQMHANQGSGRNELVYDGMAAHEPLVLGQVNPAPVLVTDASLTPCAEVTPVPVTCPGDCNHDGSVGVDELIKGVNIALGSADLSTCPEFDTDGSGSVEISELIAAVNAALNGCPVS